MKHCIIAKFNESVTDKAETIKEISELFASPNMAVSVVKKTSVVANIVDRPNRYDVMIVLEMDEEDLPEWDQSALHQVWKERYGDMLEKKAIFDCE